MKKYAIVFINALLFAAPVFSNKIEFNQSQNKKGFIENKGQICNQNGVPNAEVLFKLDNPGMNIQIKKNGFSYDTYSVSEEKAEMPISVKGDTLNYTFNYHFHRVDVFFEGASENSVVETSEKSIDHDNYYNIPHLPEGVKNVFHYQKIYIRGLYPGIDLEYVSRSDSEKPFEYNFIIHPGADASVIRMRYKGAPVSLKGNRLFFELENGKLIEDIPSSWTKDKLDGSLKEITVKYFQIDATTFGFMTPDIKSNQTLVIDPSAVITWSTYYGGNNEDVVFGATTDAAGNIYITGYTSSTNAIATSGTHQTTFAGGSYDGFLAKFNTNGSRIFGTYFGGSALDISTDVTIDGSGNPYIVGYTQGSSGIATAGTQQTTASGDNDAIIIKFNSSGIRIWGTYYGGSGSDQGFGCKADASGNIYITGTTMSLSGMSTAGAHQTNNNGGPFDQMDGFIAKFNSSGLRVWGTYYGGENLDDAYGCNIDASGNLYVVGRSLSTTSIATAGTHQFASNGDYDGFITKFNSSGVRLWGTYYGGSDGDEIWNCSFDATGNIFVSGFTLSFDGIPSAGSYNTFWGAGFVAKFSSNGLRLWGTFVTSRMYGCSTTTTGDVFVCGKEGSIMKFSPSGSFIWEYNHGGTLDDIYYSACIDGTNYYAAGYTLGSAQATSGVHQSTIGGNKDGLLTKFFECSLDIDVSVLQNPICFGNTTSVTVSAIGGQSPFAGTGTFTSGVGSNTYTITDADGCSASETVSINILTTPLQNVCLVTVDSATANYNVVAWEKPSGTFEIDSFYIYREVSASVYTKIGAVAYEDSSVFEDFNANPNQQSWKYKISVLDTCGAESSVSLYHETIHLQYLANGNFSWNHYIIEPSTNPVANYIIEKDDAGTGTNWYIIGAPVGNSFTDIAYAATPNAIYRVHVSWAISCTPSRVGVNTSRSNIKNQGLSNDVSEILNDIIHIYPNPSSSFIQINSSSFYPVSDIQIYDASGRLIKSETINSSFFELEIEDLERGIYFIDINSLIGKTTRKITKQ